MSVSEYMEKSGTIKPLRDRLSQKQKKPADWSPSLNQMLKELVDHGSLDIPAQALRRLDKLIKHKDSFISVELLDAFAHNRYSLPTVSELRSLSDTLEPLLELVLDPSRIKKVAT